MENQQIEQIIGSPTVLWFILGLVLLFFAVTSIILLYHWRKYRFESQNLSWAERTYFPVAVILIAFAILSIIMYTTV